MDKKGIVVSVGQTLDIDITLKLAGVTEAVEVRAETRSSSARPRRSARGRRRSHREPPAQRPSVRERGHHHSAASASDSLRTDQEHAVLAADAGGNAAT